MQASFSQASSEGRLQFGRVSGREPLPKSVINLSPKLTVFMTIIYDWFRRKIQKKDIATLAEFIATNQQYSLCKLSLRNAPQHIVFDVVHALEGLGGIKRTVFITKYKPGDPAVMSFTYPIKKNTRVVPGRPHYKFISANFDLNMGRNYDTGNTLNELTYDELLIFLKTLYQIIITLIKFEFENNNDEQIRLKKMLASLSNSTIRDQLPLEDSDAALEARSVLEITQSRIQDFIEEPHQVRYHETPKISE